MTVIRAGVLTPHAAAGPEVEFARLAPGQVVSQVVRVHPPGDAGAGPPTSAAGLAALALPEVLDRAAASVASGQVDVVVHASTTTSYAIGFEAELAMEARLSQALGVPALATGTSAVRALDALGVRRLALVGAPWFEPAFVRLGAAYFEGRGFEVVASELAELPLDPDAVEVDAFVAWAVDHVGDVAEAVFVGGNGFRVAGAVPVLEETLRRPVLTANQVLLQRVLDDDR